MRITEVTTNLAAAKVLYKKPKQMDANDAKYGHHPSPQRKLITDESANSAPVKLRDLTTVRSKNSNNTLRSLLSQADTVLAHQDRLIKDLNQLLGMEKAADAYRKTSRES